MAQPFQQRPLREWNNAHRDRNNQDELVLRCRKKAREKIQKATNSNGSLNWSKLPKLLTVNPKVIKGEKYGYKTAILHFAPSWMSGYNMCPFAKGCGEVCLTFSGHGQENMQDAEGNHSVHIARITRSILWFEHRIQFLTRMLTEIRLHEKKCAKLDDDIHCVVRLNGTSDIEWEKVWPLVFSHFPDVVFYDYAKNFNRNVDHIPNYSLTYSAQEGTEDECIEALHAGKNVAVVLRLNARKYEAIPNTFWGFPTVDGDESDLRFLDPQGGRVVALRSKGKAYHDTSGFVYDVAPSDNLLIAAE